MAINNVDALYINELFLSIQGESSRAGLPCGFIRFAGCNLRCVWCDTAYAFEGGKEMSPDEILKVVTQWHIPLVEITGGEPLLQFGCTPLAELLLEKGHTLLIETNGTLPIDVLPEGAIRIMDIKCPDSGMSDKIYWPNIELLNCRDEVKFVLASRGDYEWARDVIHRYTLEKRCAAVLLSAVTGDLDAARLAAWMLEDQLEARLQLQLHKIIWSSDQRGV
ncbi:MAG: radical SAM protein [Candidatus Hydrogenedentes bacterium]|nr:radical SAM protein [Candidatus Hydrogenedentota bacterium]